MKLTDYDVWQRLVLKYYIPTKKLSAKYYRKVFCQIKRLKKIAYFA